MKMIQNKLHVKLRSEFQATVQPAVDWMELRPPPGHMTTSQLCTTEDNSSAETNAGEALEQNCCGLQKRK